MKKKKINKYVDVEKWKCPIFTQRAQSAKTVTWKRGSATNQEMKPFSPKRERHAEEIWHQTRTSWKHIVSTIIVFCFFLMAYVDDYTMIPVTFVQMQNNSCLSLEQQASCFLFSLRIIFTQFLCSCLKVNMSRDWFVCCVTEVSYAHT